MPEWVPSLARPEALPPADPTILLNGVNRVAQVLLAEPDFGRAAPAALRALREATEVSRVYLFENRVEAGTGALLAESPFEDVAPGVVVSREQPGRYPMRYADFGAELIATLAAGRTVQFLANDAPAAALPLLQIDQARSLLAVPIMVEGHWWGVVGFDDCVAERRWEESEIAVLETAAAMFAGALLRRESALARDRRDALLRAVAEAARCLAVEEDFTVGLGRAVAEIGKLSGFDRVYVARYRDDEGIITLLAEHAQPPLRPLREIEPGWARLPMADFPEILAVHRRGEPWISSEAGRQGRNAELNRAAGTKSDVMVPILVRGQHWGLIGFDTQEDVKWASAHLDVLQAAAAAIASAVLRRDAEAATVRAGEESRAELRKANLAMRRSLDGLAGRAGLRDYLGGVVLEAVRCVDAKTGAVFVRPPGTDLAELVHLAVDGALVDLANDPRGEFWRRPLDLAAENSDAWRQLEADRVTIDVIDESPSHLAPSSVAWHRRMGHRMVLMAPLRVGREVIGLFGLAYADTRSVRQEQLELVHALAQQASLALHLTRLAEKAEAAVVAQERAAAAQAYAAELARSHAVLSSINERLAQGPTAADLLGHIVAMTCERLGSSAAALFELSGDGAALVPLSFVHRGQGVAAVPGYPYTREDPMPVAEYPGWPELVRQRAAHFLDLAREQPAARTFAWHRAEGHQALLVGALLSGAEPIGLLGIAFTHREPPSPDELGVFRALVLQASLALQHMRLTARAQSAATLAERNRIAREVHDTLAQGFTGVIMQLDAMATFAGGIPPAGREHLQRARDLARNSLAEARRSVHALRPLALTANTLAGALERLLRPPLSPGLPRMEFELAGPVRPLAAELEVDGLRLAQEAIANALKHAGAACLRARLEFQPDRVVLTVADDGRGFDPTVRTDGCGLLGMRERVERHGGSLALRTAPGAGTTLTFTLPAPLS